MAFDVVYVSPHADDVAFSAAGQLARDVAAGARVALLTLFDPPHDPKGHSQPSARRAEDQAFVARAGVTHLTGGWPDALERRPRYRHARSLFAPLRADEAGLVDGVRARLQALVDDGCRTLVAPLGVGQHVDHQAAHAAARAVRGAARWFYEDTPYVLTPYQLARRLGMLGLSAAATGDDATLARGTRRQELGALARTLGRAPFLRARVGPRLRPLAVATLVWPQLRAPAPGPNARRIEAEILDGNDLSATRLSAIACYASQWPLFYATLDEWAAALAAYAGAIGRGRVVERRWRISDGDDDSDDDGDGDGGATSARR